MHRKLVLATLGPILLPALSAACSGSSNYADEYAAYQQCIDQETAKLKPAAAAGTFGGGLEVSDEASVVTLLRANIKSAARTQLDARRISLLAQKRCQPLYPTDDDMDEASAGSPRASSPNSAADGSGESAKQASGTNNQVANVDEADFVKNDNKYIYVVNGSRFRIIDAFPGADMRELSQVKINGEAKKLFVEGNRAVVYSSIAKASDPSGGSGNGSRNWWSGGYGGASECTYGQNGCVPSGDGTETEIAIYDLTDRTRPTLVRTIHSSSSFVAARRIGNAVHTVLAQPSQLSIPYPSANVRQDDPESTINAVYAQALASAEAEIDAQVITGSVMPTWTDSASLPITKGLYRSASPDGDSLTSVLTLDLAAPAAVNVTSIVSSPGWTYASADSLYLAVPHQRGGWGWFESNEDELTTVHKFALAPKSSTYFGSGFVTGRVLNQLAMDEQNGFLRLATTAGHLPDPKAKNLMTILEPQSGPAGNTLATVGKIDDIAPTEDIRSARFDGDRGYIVTFKKTDPLYVFDLKDPRAPRILGELKIPGFSTYMHMMDATHLLTIGYDAADKGDFAFFTGIMLQIFDVSNPADPRLTHKEVIGSRGTSSEAATNHLAFTYFAPKNLLALPMTVCEGGNENGGYGTKMTFSGLMVYDVTAQDGFKLRGRVAHPSVTDQPTNDYGYYDASCSNWWTNANSEVKRSIIMDDWVYSVSESRIKANTLGNLGTDVREVSIADASSSQEQTGDRF